MADPFRASERLRAARRLLRLNANLVSAVGMTAARRRLYGPRQSSWSWWFESLQQMMAASTPNNAEAAAEEIRAALGTVANFPILATIQVEPVMAGGVPAEWVLAPNQEQIGVVLFLHGGGYISGSPRTHRPLIAAIAYETGARVLALDYRLAPEHPYPAALEDAWLAYWWLLEQDVAPRQIAVMGDSAGGGLTMALLLALRDAHAPLPAAAAGLSPWFDLALQGDSLHTNAGTDYLNEHILRNCARYYLGEQCDPQHTPLASPLYANLAGLPPLLLQVGTAEMLLDDARRFAQAARAAGVEVELEIWDDMIHVWHFLYRMLPEARQAVEHLGLFVRKHIKHEPVAR
jgi:acetyl esterase/lipase